MGMFDSVYTTCPNCNEQVEFQSKAGPCELKNYSIASVPPEVAADIAGDTKQCECGFVLRIKTLAPIPRIQMRVVDGLLDDDDISEFD